MSDDTDSDVVDAGYDEWLDAVRADDGYYLACENDHGSLPPRRVCPHCGSLEIEETPLPDAGEIETVTVTHVATPNFTEDTPYATAIAAFGDVRITGQVRDVDLDDVDVGMQVSVDVDETATTGDDVVVFRPR
jgi:uncharacterized OB-fold protein